MKIKCDNCEEIIEYSLIDLLYGKYFFCCQDCLDEFIKENTLLKNIEE